LEYIEHKLPYNNTVIVIKDIQFLIADFQIEGIYGAIIQYLSSYFSFGLPEIRTPYNKTANKYVFDKLE